MVWEPIRNKLTRKSSGNTRPQSSPIAEPLWTDPGLKSGISVREIISTLKKKQAGNEVSNILPKSTHARKSTTCTLASQSFLWRSVPVCGCLPVHPDGWLRGGCLDGLPVGCVLPYDTLNTLPPPPAVVITSLFRPLPHHFYILIYITGTRFTDTLLVLMNYNSDQCHHTITSIRDLYNWYMVHVLFDAHMQCKNDGGGGGGGWP